MQFLLAVFLFSSDPCIVSPDSQDPSSLIAAGDSLFECQEALADARAIISRVRTENNERERHKEFLERTQSVRDYVRGSDERLEKAFAELKSNEDISRIRAYLTFARYAYSALGYLKSSSLLSPSERETSLGRQIAGAKSDGSSVEDLTEEQLRRSVYRNIYYLQKDAEKPAEERLPADVRRNLIYDSIANLSALGAYDIPEEDRTLILGNYNIPLTEQNALVEIINKLQEIPTSWSDAISPATMDNAEFDSLRTDKKLLEEALQLWFDEQKQSKEDNLFLLPMADVHDFDEQFCAGNICDF